MSQLSNKPAFTHKGRPFSFAQVRTHWDKNKANLMPVMGQIAVNFFKDRFRAQAWTDRSAKRWQKRDPKTKKQKRRNKGRAILVSSGKLLKSIRLQSVSGNTITIGSNISYAAAHNFGFKGDVRVKQHSRTVRGRAAMQNIETRRKSSVQYTKGSHSVKAHTRRANLPQRQFMGNSHTLNRKFEKVIIYNITKSFKQ